MQRDTWRQVHGELVRLARAKGAYDADEARWLLEGKRVRVHEPLGYGSYFSYLEHVLGYGPRMAAERLRVAEALAGLSSMMDALANGELCWSAVRELTRVAVAATEVDWIAAAGGKSVREVEDMVSGRRPGDRPCAPADPGAVRHVLRLEVSADGLAAFRDARRRIELDVGHSLDDDAAVRMLAHYALEGPGEPGRAAYQVAVTVCERCRRGTRDGAGRELAVEPHEIEAAQCDAQHIGETHVGAASSKATQTIPPRVRRLVVRRAHGRCQVPGCRAAKFLEVHHIVHRADGGTHDPSLLILVCSAHHMQLHRGALSVCGTAPDHLEFRRPHETRPASATRAAAGDLHADALDALRGLGFSAAEARRALAASSDAGDLDALLRQALAQLRPPVQVSRASEPPPRFGSRLCTPAAAPGPAGHQGARTVPARANCRSRGRPGGALGRQGGPRGALGPGPAPPEACRPPADRPRTGRRPAAPTPPEPGRATRALNVRHSRAGKQTSRRGNALARAGGGR